MTPNYYRLLRPLAFSLPPEAAHRAALMALPLLPRARVKSDPALQTHVFGLHFPHPIGIAAGFDKNAQVILPLFAQGFSFVEAGTITPRPQPGNPRPRLFRLQEDEAVINRLGFPGDGKDAVLKRLAALPQRGGILGINIGKNKDSTDAARDYADLLAAFAPHADYIAVNVSSPNTPGLRDLQSKDALNQLLQVLMDARATLPRRVPLLLKIAPDLDDTHIADIAEAALAHSIDGLIVSNTTTARPDLRSSHAKEQGGLSGRPLFAPSTQVLTAIYRATQGRIPLIGVGGVASAEDAYAKIRAGASLVQVYTALVYQGFGLVGRMVEALPGLLARDGFKTIGEAVGADVKI